MNEILLGPRALGGGPLEGDNVTKFVHMDEAGISHGEPFCVQVGVIVDADLQWKQIEQRMAGLIHELVPREHLAGYVFHAKDVFHGTDPAFSKERMPNPVDRAHVVRQFAGITKEFGLPIIFGWVKRENLDEEFLAGPKRQVAENLHAMAYIDCVRDVDQWLCDFTPRDVAMLIIENNNESRRFLQTVHGLLKLPVENRPVKFEGIPRFRRIVEQPSFADKEPLSPLQIADACAFSIARCLKKGAHWEILYEGVRDGVTSWPWFVEPPASS